VPRLAGAMERTTIGRAQLHSFVTSDPKLFTLAADPTATGPHFFLVHSGTPFYLRQGGSDVEVTTLDPVVFGRTYYQVVVFSEVDNYISVRPLASAGQGIQVFEVGSARPGVGASTETDDIGGM